MISDLYKYCIMLDTLYNQQNQYEKKSEEWNILEKKIIELECKIFNELILLKNEDKFFLYSQLPILPIIGVHLYQVLQQPQHKDFKGLLKKETISLLKDIVFIWNKSKIT